MGRLSACGWRLVLGLGCRVGPHVLEMARGLSKRVFGRSPSSIRGRSSDLEEPAASLRGQGSYAEGVGKAAEGVGAPVH